MLKTITVRFMVTPEEREELDRLAKAMNMSISDIVRQGIICLAKKVKLDESTAVPVRVIREGKCKTMKAICKFCGKEGNLGSEIVLAVTKELGSQRVITYYLCANEGACKERISRKEVSAVQSPSRGRTTE